ncbi:hypothetical protein PF004_g11016 [Phytophthora fragariae]|uniref:DDE Tnp4 domain-containing protein n=1 Tax=Phytophthora fragariae TaxID=53985 RepID=A0A6G0NZ58_9STRA|nr:hypothetical protein PF004_g11016 [Phytophthora fragariae]
MLLYKFGSDINFINATSLTRPAFHQLMRSFARFYFIPKAKFRGRPPKLRYLHQVLGLVLSFYVGSMEQSSLSMLTHVVAITNRLAELAKLVEAREPLLKYTFGFIDGKNFKLRTICFAADGCIIWSRHNCPGSWNESDTSLGFRVKLLDPAFCPDPRMNVVSDSAFPCSTAMTGRILTPLKGGDLKRILPSLRASARTLHNAITSVCQAAEWDMGSVQKVYFRLNLPLPVRTVGISQIRTTFAGEMEVPTQVC